MLSDVTDPGVASKVLPDPVVDTLNPNAPTAETSSNDADTFDMFAEDDEHATAEPLAGPNTDTANQPSSDILNADSGSKLYYYFCDSCSNHK